MLLKGPSVASWLYADGGNRTYGDTDILIAPHEVSHVEEGLQDLGFETVGAPLTDDRPWTAQDWRRGADGAVVDLHRTLEGLDAEPEDVWALLRSRAETMVLLQREVRVLDIPSRCMHVALHAAKHGADGQPFVDLERALEQEPEAVWREAQGVAEELGGLAAFSAGLRLSPKGSHLAEQWELPQAPVSELSLSVAEAPPAAAFISWLGSLSWRRRIRLLSRKLFPPPDYIRSWAPWAGRNAATLALAYCWRPLFLAPRGLRGLGWYLRSGRGKGARGK